MHNTCYRYLYKPLEFHQPPRYIYGILHPEFAHEHHLLFCRTTAISNRATLKLQVTGKLATHPSKSGSVGKLLYRLPTLQLIRKAE